MVSLLLLNQMHAVKLEEGTGTFKVSVPEGEFVSAVERLRQSGLPQRKFLTIDALFPTNQLVSSPAQEAAKLAYLKEQRLESLLSSLEGVIEVHVIISEPTTSKNGAREQQTPCTASVLIKHAADANLENFITQIKSLAKTSVAGLEYENISVVLQWTEYRGEGKEG